MTATEEFILDWLKKAEHDLKIAQIALAAEEEIYDAICFHAQQLAEKAIKALATARGIEFPKTHNLSILANLVQDADINEYDAYFERLSGFAVESRYPGEYDEPDREEAEAFIKIAAEIYGVCRAKIGL